jgi:hypothetical protein
MSILTLDTLKFANRLKKAGISSVQAEANALSGIFEAHLNELITKDVKLV